MADFQLLTPALNSQVTTQNIVMAESATAGMVITDTGFKAISTDSSKINVAGILYDDANAGETGVVVRPSTRVGVTPVLIKGGILILSSTAGLVKYADEVVATDNVVIVAFNRTTTELEVFIKKTNVLV